MTRLEQRCKGVAKALDDYNIKYLKEYDSNKHLKIIGTPFHIEVTNKYIGISYKKGHYCNFLPSFEGINEFRNFIQLNGTNFMKLKKQLEEKDKVIAEAINKIETLRMEKWSIMGTDIMEILDILERGKNENSKN